MTRSAQKKQALEARPATRKQISKQAQAATALGPTRMTTRKQSADSSANQSAQSASKSKSSPVAATIKAKVMTKKKI